MNARGKAATPGGIEPAEWQRRIRVTLADFACQWGRPESCSTAELVECLWPAKNARGPGQISERQQLFRCILKWAEGPLADCCSRGPEKGTRFGRTIRPWVWHAPKAKCEHCNGTGFAS